MATRLLGTLFAVGLVVASLVSGCAGRESGDTPQVTLYHCGVNPVTYDGRSWKVPHPKFDLTNFPDTFSGQGHFKLRGENTLVFTDEKGAKLVFKPAKQVPDRACA
ncbi:MAG: hypothetical protein ABJA81_07925 [Nocardioidaceae bacterium]